MRLLALASGESTAICGVLKSCNGDWVLVRLIGSVMWTKLPEFFLGPKK
jgi:hypothetical protein